jgi:lipopolysaccharide transport system permease protein
MNSALEHAPVAPSVPQTAGWQRVAHRWLPARLVEVWNYRELIYNLVVRNLKVRYKNSLLGICWSLLNPLLMMLVFTILFQVFLSQSIPHYSIFVLAAILPWNFFSGAVADATHSITANAHLVKKVYFPREVLTIAAVLSHLVHFLLALLVLVPMLYLAGIGLTWHALWLPVIVLTQVIFIMGLAFALATFNVYYRDTAMVMDVAMMGWFFLTPIFWQIELLPQSKLILGFDVNVHRWVRWLNPMASLIDSYRTTLYGSTSGAGPAEPALDFLLRTLVTALVIMVIGWWIFARKSREFGEEV